MSEKIEGGPGLRELQSAFAARLLAVQRNEETTLEKWLCAPPRGDRNERLAVYANGYPARVEEALRETFPAVAHLLGSHGFADLTLRYTRARPPLAYNLNNIGAALPAYLVFDPANVDLPFLADVAELEWRLSRAFHAREQTPLDPAATRGWTIDDWPRAVLRFQPSLALVCSPWPIRTLWELRDTPREQIDLDLRDRPERVAVYRSGREVCCELLDESEARALLAAIAGRALGEVADQLAADGHTAESAFAWLPRLRAHGVITGCALAKVDWAR